MKVWSNNNIEDRKKQWDKIISRVQSQILLRLLSCVQIASKFIITDNNEVSKLWDIEGNNLIDCNNNNKLLNMLITFKIITNIIYIHCIYIAEQANSAWGVQ